MLLADGLHPSGGTLALTRLDLLVIDGTTDNEEAPFLLGPAAAGCLERLPSPCVEFVELRTHVGHIETLRHGTCIPFVVGSGTHVPPVITTPLVILRRHLLTLIKQRVRPEVIASPAGSLGLPCREFPSHPVGVVVVGVEGHGIGQVREHKFSPCCGGQFQLAVTPRGIGSGGASLIGPPRASRLLCPPLLGCRRIVLHLFLIGSHGIGEFPCSHIHQ